MRRHKPFHRVLSSFWVATGLWFVAGVCLAQTTPSPTPVVAEIESGLVMTLNFSRVNTATGDTLTTEDPKTDRLINEMLEALSTGDFDPVGYIAFIHKYHISGNPPGGTWDTVYLPVSYDGGGYDTCNWVRWRAGYKVFMLKTYDIVYSFYLLPGEPTPELSLSDAYATEQDNLNMVGGDSLAITWEYVQSASP